MRAIHPITVTLTVAATQKGDTHRNDPHVAQMIARFRRYVLSSGAFGGINYAPRFSTDWFYVSWMN